MKEKRWLSSSSVYLWTGEGQFKPASRRVAPLRLTRRRQARNRMRFKLFEHLRVE